ncbi:MAG: VOC family protein [Aestuariivirgaceae bacterium]
MNIDHLVWFTPDLAAGERYFAERLDAAPVFGGAHPGDGTCNNLLSLGDASYLEILARDPGQPASNRSGELRDLTGQGIYHWAVSAVDLDDIVSRSRDVGATPGAISESGRRRPDGSWLGWRVLGLAGHPYGGLVPFFIDWGESRHPARTAPRGGTLTGVELVHPQAERLQTFLDGLGLKIPVSRGGRPAMRASIDTAGGRVVVSSIDPMPSGFAI